MPSNSSITSLLWVGRFEAISYLLLLGVAMPLKYFWGQPAAVKWVGWAHGVLFTVYALQVLSAWSTRQWPLSRPLLLGIAAMLPFGPFWIEKKLAAWGAEPPRPNSGA